MVSEKERKNFKSEADLCFSDSAKQKAKEYVKKYMASKGSVFKNLEAAESKSSYSPVNGNSQDGLEDQLVLDEAVGLEEEEEEEPMAMIDS